MRRLNSLEAFQVARQVSGLAYRLTLERGIRSHLALIDQIRRAAISVPANVAEGYALGTRAQLARHLRIALGSSSELQCHLRLLQDLDLVQRGEVTEVIDRNDRLIALLVGLLKKYGARPDVP